MTNEELNTLQEEAYDHLWNGRYRMALDAARKVYNDRPDESEAAICFAWALLENGNPVKAMEYANLAVELKGDSTKAHLYRGYLLMRMSIFEGANADFDYAIHQQKDSLAWAYINKARTLAGMEKFSEAEKTLELAIIIDNGKNPKWKEAFSFYKSAKELHNGKIELTNDNIDKYFEQCAKAIKRKEYWFTLFISRRAQNNFKNIKKDDRNTAELIELEAMFYLYQFRPALKKAELMKSKFKKDEKFNNIYNSLRKFTNHEESAQQEVPQKKTTVDKEPPSRKTRVSESSGKTHALFFPNKNSEVFSAKVFDADMEDEDGGRKYCLEFNSERIKTIGVEVIFNNPFYGELAKDFDCKAVWYLNDFEINSSEFKLHVKKNWDSVIFAQSLEIGNGNSQAYGQARVDIYIENFRVCEKWFVIGEREVVQRPETPDIPKDSAPELEKETKQDDESAISAQIHDEEDTRSLEELLEELDTFVGLQSIKTSLREFVDYLKFIEERKQKGLKVEENISLNTLFLGNPGTGKTTVARLLGKIFKAMGILEKGHVVEVDRTAIVGQYIGETAQKTEKVINDAMQGVLFIDEAYTLVKKGGSGQDFGQEAIDVLLKRMEDKKGEFIVVAAGYPEEMETFMASNPGLKSRFVRKFTFEDYSPEELYKIYHMKVDKEDYIVNDDAQEILQKHFTKLYRGRDKSFGNARMAIQFFEDTKINLSKRYLRLDEEEKTKEQMTTICADDVKGLLSTDIVDEVSIPINEEELQESLTELNELIGIDSVKKEIKDTVKLARYYTEQNEDVSDKFSSHILFMETPVPGKQLLQE